MSESIDVLFITDADPHKTSGRGNTTLFPGILGIAISYLSTSKYADCTRGTGKTIPFECKLAELAELQGRDIESLVHLNLTEHFLKRGWHNAEYLAERCYSTMNASGELIGTAFVARDMVQIIDGLGEDGLLRY